MSYARRSSFYWLETVRAYELQGFTLEFYTRMSMNNNNNLDVSSEVTMSTCSSCDVIGSLRCVTVFEATVPLRCLAIHVLRALLDLAIACMTSPRIWTLKLSWVQLCCGQFLKIRSINAGIAKSAAIPLKNLHIRKIMCHYRVLLKVITLTSTSKCPNNS